jgi:hypothetical protein
MDYDIPWHELTIDVTDAVRKDFVIEDLLVNSEFTNAPGGIWHFQADTIEQVLSTDWIQRMHEIGIPVRNLMVFYRTPHFLHSSAHIDLLWSGGPALSAINWVIDAQDDSEMIWYDFPPDPPIEDITPAKTKFQDWPLEQIAPYECARKIIGTTPTLVCTGIPHNVETYSRSRWCLSVRYRSPELTSWKNTVDFFRPWIKNVNS